MIEEIEIKLRKKIERELLAKFGLVLHKAHIDEERDCVEDGFDPSSKEYIAACFHIADALKDYIKYRRIRSLPMSFEHPQGWNNELGEYCHVENGILYINGIAYLNRK